MSELRQELYEQIMMTLLKAGINNSDIGNAIHIILSKYEITNRSTEIAILKEDRNEFLIKKFLMAKMVAGRTKRTIDYYRQQLEIIIPAIGKTVDDITADDIRLYLAVRQTRDGICKNTAGNELRVMRSFFQYLTTEELVQKNPTAKIDSIKIGRRKENAFSEIEVEKIRDATINNRERALIEILLSTACRIGEISSMKIQEIKVDHIIVHGKGEKDRTVYLNAKAALAIEKYLAERNDSNPYIFCGGKPWGSAGGKYGHYHHGEWYKIKELVGDSHSDVSSLEQRVRRIGKRSGVENVHPHRFRRTCATLALRRGMPIEKVSKMLGHEELDTTKIYISTDEEELEQAHRKYVI